MRKGLMTFLCTVLTMWCMGARAENKMYITIDGQTESVTLADTKAAEELMEALKQGNITVTLNDNDFEIWGALGRTLTQSDEQVEAQPGDIVLYNGSYICIFYSSNSWSYTRLGKIDGLTEQGLRSFLKAGSSGISVLLSASNPTAIRGIKGKGKDKADSACYSVSGQRVSTPANVNGNANGNGLYIKNGNKIIQ